MKTRIQDHILQSRRMLLLFVLSGLFLAGCMEYKDLEHFGVTPGAYPCDPALLDIRMFFGTGGPDAIFFSKRQTDIMNPFHHDSSDDWNCIKGNHGRDLAGPIDRACYGFSLYHEDPVNRANTIAYEISCDPFTANMDRDEEKNFIHTIACEFSGLGHGDTITFRSPESRYYSSDSYNTEVLIQRIPTRIDLDIQASVGFGTNVAFSGSVVGANSSICPGFSPLPSGNWFLQVEGDERRYMGWAPGIWLHMNFTSAEMIHTYRLTYSGDRYYAPAEITGTFKTGVCLNPFTRISIDNPPSGLPVIPVTIGITALGRAFDDMCVASELVEGSVAITSERYSQGGPTCTIELEGGAGSCELVFDVGGTYALMATYEGEGFFESGTASGEITIEKLASTTEITSLPTGQLRVGRPVRVSVTVSGPGPTPTGQVIISGGGSECIAELADGLGSCNLIPVSAGGTDITAEYQGDDAYHPSSTVYGASVQPAKQTTVSTITGSTFSGTCTGGPYPNLVTVRVSGVGGTPTGTVAITGADTNCTITLSGGVGSCTVFFNDSTDTTIYASYSGDANFLTSQGTGRATICW